ncbi:MULTISPECIES: DUF4258 domain-containing protein [unclassified Methylobacterium]|uniref:DUF4258 domain-containing protein n=1 Tax=unclassified Methylobacterium TaxID=2615210 RepID=UPI003144DFF0
METVRIRWSDHALGRMRLRAIEPLWVERVVAEPELVEADLNHPGRLRAFARVPECGGRVLRVVYEPLQDGAEALIITALLDRGRTRNWRTSG